MVDITHKNYTLRKAIAYAEVCVGNEATIQAILDKKIPKGDVFEMAKVAGLFAVKKTSDMIPDCHPLPIEFAKVSYKIEGLRIMIEMEVHTIYKTGVEVEAMHGASVVALTIYDMLKPIDKNISIEKIKLLEKQGGKSSFPQGEVQQLTCAILVYSDEVYQGKKKDSAGKATLELMEYFSLNTISYELLEQNEQKLKDKIQTFKKQKTNLILVVGATGAGKKDNSPEIIKQCIDKELPGVMEASRAYGQSRTPYAMLSRGIAGVSEQSLMMSIPGSTQGAKETIQAVFPSLFHIFKTLKIYE